MGPVSFFDDLGPHARVAIALAPFLIAIVLRLILGKNRVTRILLSVSTTWFAIIVLLTPYSSHVQNDIESIRSIFR